MFEDLKEPYEKFTKEVEKKYPDGCKGIECVNCEIYSSVDAHSVTICYALRSLI